MPELEQNCMQRFNVEKVAKKLIEDLSSVHATFLLINRRIVKSINLHISSTPNKIIHNGWKDFGHKLGLAALELEYIQNGNHTIYNFHRSNTQDCTEITLYVFAQNKDATVGKILEALLDIQRLDVIGKIIKDLEELSPKKFKIESFISKYIALNVEIKTVDGIVTPVGLPEYISRILPTALSKDITTAVTVTERRIPHTETLLQSEVISVQDPPQNVSQVVYCKLVMLTFAADGEVLAKKVAQTLRNKKVNNMPIGVLMLQEHRDSVLRNAEEFIMHLFPQMDFIVPILTEDYLKALTNANPTTNNIDEYYLKFIYDLMAKYYVDNYCKNDKFRCVIPKPLVHAIVRDKQLTSRPMLRSWFNDSDIESLANTIITAHN